MKCCLKKLFCGIWWFIYQTIDPHGKISSASLIGIVSCFLAILGFVDVITVTEPSKLFEWGLIALAFAAGESITAIIKKK